MITLLQRIRSIMARPTQGPYVPESLNVKTGKWVPLTSPNNNRTHAQEAAKKACLDSSSTLQTRVRSVKDGAIVWNWEASSVCNPNHTNNLPPTSASPEDAEINALKAEMEALLKAKAEAEAAAKAKAEAEKASKQVTNLPSVSPSNPISKAEEACYLKAALKMHMGEWNEEGPEGKFPTTQEAFVNRLRTSQEFRVIVTEKGVQVPSCAFKPATPPAPSAPPARVVNQAPPTPATPATPPTKVSKEQTSAPTTSRASFEESVSNFLTNPSSDASLRMVIETALVHFHAEKEAMAQDLLKKVTPTFDPKPYAASLAKAIKAHGAALQTIDVVLEEGTSVQFVGRRGTVLGQIKSADTLTREKLDEVMNLVSFSFAEEFVYEGKDTLSYVAS